MASAWTTDSLGFEVAASAAAPCPLSAHNAAPPSKRRASAPASECTGSAASCSGSRPPPSPHSRLSLDGTAVGGGVQLEVRAQMPKPSVRYECPCGSSFSRTMLQYHQSTEAHRSWLSSAHRQAAAAHGFGALAAESLAAVQPRRAATKPALNRLRLEANLAGFGGASAAQKRKDTHEDYVTPKAGQGAVDDSALRNNLLSVLAGLSAAAK